jgi:putative transposase
MADYAHRGHTVSELRYHVVWVTEYRYPVLGGEIGLRAREVIRQVCEARGDDDHQRGGVAGSRACVCECPAATGPGADDAVDQGAP